MKPTWQTDDGQVQLYLADCLTVLPILETEDIGAVITDPPYGVDLNYNATFNDSEEYWQQVIVPAIKQSLQLTRGPIFVFGAAPCDRMWVYEQLHPQRCLVWTPRFTLSHTQSNGIFYRWHPIWCWQLPKDCKPLWSDVLDIPCDGHNWWYHPGTKPVNLMKMLVAVSTGVVLDPFMGSGSTGVACLELGQKFIGIEISPDYFRVAVKRVEQAKMQLHLPLQD